MFNEKVIDASRDFVCIRLATYEDESEAEFLRSIYVNRTGDLDNTVFVMLSPDTKQDLCKAGRGPQFEFRRPDSLVKAMNEIAKEFVPTERESGTAPVLPQLKNVRLGLNVSSCDGLPSIICVAKDKKQSESMHDALAPLAFSEELAGKFVYATTTDPSELKSVESYDGKPGYLLIEPSEYGVEGKLIKSFAMDTDAEALKTELVRFAKSSSRVSKNHRSHVSKGVQEDKFWETEIPVTDQGSVKAMERNQSQRGKK